VRIVPGDARLQLRHAPPAHYGLLVLDAFSSDSIPSHLLTREAFELYLSKLAPGGLLALHISNRYLDLEPVVAAAAAELHLICRSAYDMDDDPANGKEESHWLLLARDERDLGKLQKATRWFPVQPRPGTCAWTDDFSNILGVFEWK
ncbi:MAG: fused MFS/spermidine synthase, partial [Verrucomicrobia bacterium]|nr:fused MFS/spermidine synthase [Verrucomicrobiota bacterium]